jgi:hypothetical protein
MTTSPTQRAELRALLRRRAPWIDDSRYGPRTVDAGLCDRCERLPRLLSRCGPDGGGAVCRPCAIALGDDGFCDGHRDVGRDARAWAARLPDDWPDVVLAWWLASGELRTADADMLTSRP